MLSSSLAEEDDANVDWSEFSSHPSTGLPPRLWLCSCAVCMLLPRQQQDRIGVIEGRRVSNSEATRPGYVKLMVHGRSTIKPSPLSLSSASASADTECAWCTMQAL